MLRGTTLGWALEAGFNRVWIAGWRLWLPVLMLVDLLLWAYVREPLLYPEVYPATWSIGLWAAGPGLPDSWAEILVGTPAQRMSPVAYFEEGSAASILIGLVCLSGWLWERRHPRSTARRTFTRTPLIPLLGVICIGGPLVGAALLRAEFAASQLGIFDQPDHGAALSMQLCAVAALGALVVWMPLSRDRRALLPVMLSAAGIVGFLAGRSALAEQLYRSGSPQLMPVMFSVVNWVAWGLLPLLLGACLGRVGPAKWFRQGGAVVVITVMACGVHVLLEVLATVLGSGVSGSHSESDPQVFWIVPTLLVAAVEGGRIVLSLWLVAAIASLGEAGEHAAPVDAAAA